MNSFSLHPKASLAQRLEVFEQEWNSGKVPEIHRFLQGDLEDQQQFVEDLIELDLECRWKRFDARSDPSSRDRFGFPDFPLIEDYLEILPEPIRHALFTPRCVAEEYRVRFRWGDKPKKESFFQRFPSVKTEIEAALHDIDTDLRREGLLSEDESSLSVAAEHEPTASLKPSSTRQSRLVSESALAGRSVGKYQLHSRLGHGSFGEVWKAFDADLNRWVAIKFPRLDKQFSEELLESFRSEARKLAALGHIQGIVDVFDLGEFNQKPYFVSKLIEGESLADRMRRERLSPEESALLIAKVAESLKRAHQQKLVHRDIKPANILLDKEENPYLADFGMAATDQEQLNEERNILGTIAYMAPEQARGDSHRVDGRADIYALGVVLYRLLTNELPYGGKDNAQFLENVKHQKPRPPRQIEDSVPLKLEQICLKCLKKDEDERYSSAGELAEELRKSTVSKNTNPWLGLVIAALVCLCLFSIIVLLQSGFSTTSPPESVWSSTKTIVWEPYNDLTDSYGFNNERQRYEFDTLGPALFQLGENTSNTLKLETRFRIHGHERVGEAGVFWGFGKVNDDERIDFCCWTLRIGRPHESQPFQLEIQQVSIGPASGRNVVLDTRPVWKTTIEDPTSQLIDLQLEVTDTRVLHVTVNGETLLEDSIPLRAIMGRDWKTFINTGYGMCGEFGSFSYDHFSAE